MLDNPDQWQRPTLPHAGLMRWVKSAALTSNSTVVVALADIPQDHPFVRDGLLQRSALIELMAQAAAAGSAMTASAAGRRVKYGVLAAIPEFTVHGDVIAGAQVTLRAIHKKTFASLSQARLEAHAGGILIADARMTFHLTFE